MEIKKVQIREDGGFLVNDIIGVPVDMGNRHRVMVQEWIDAGNTPIPYVGPTDIELWKEKMAVSDIPLPRWAEDLINLTDGAISLQTQKLADDKKTLRGERP